MRAWHVAYRRREQFIETHVLPNKESKSSRTHSQHSSLIVGSASNLRLDEFTLEAAVDAFNCGSEFADWVLDNFSEGCIHVIFSRIA